MIEQLQPAEGGRVERVVRPLAERVQYLERMRSTAATKAAELRHQADRQERDAAMAATLLADVRAGACKYCNGFGKVTMQYAQDDIKTETCDRCGGSGAA